MTGHTPGPWGIFLNEETNQFEVFHDEGRGFGRMLARIVGERGRFQANARLIAAAPDLLAALEDIMEIAEMALPTTFFQSDSRCQAARTAIAKARGE